MFYNYASVTGNTEPEKNGLLPAAPSYIMLTHFFIAFNLASVPL